MHPHTGRDFDSLGRVLGTDASSTYRGPSARAHDSESPESHLSTSSSSLFVTLWYNDGEPRPRCLGTGGADESLPTSIRDAAPSFGRLSGSKRS